MDSRLVFTGMPIHEAVAIHLLLTVYTHFTSNLPHDARQVRLLLPEISQIPMMHIPIVVQNNPPHRVCTDAAHPSRQWRHVPGQVQAFRHHLVVPEYGIYRGYFGMQVTHPNQSVALDAVPEIVLHIEVYRIRPRLPNSVETLKIGRAHV